MNKFDLLAQPMARRPDAQPAKIPGSTTSSGQSSSVGWDTFSAVLKGLSEDNDTGVKRGAMAPTQQDLEQPEALTAETCRGSDEAMENLLQAIASDSASVSAQSSLGSAAYSLLEGLLPRIPGQSNPSQTTDASGGGSGAQGSGTPLPGMATSQESLLNSASAPTVRVSVQHQETHFKPVVDGFTTKVVAQGGDTPADEVVLGEQSLPTGILKDAAKKSDAATGSGSIANQSQASLGATTAQSADGEEIAAKGASADRLTGKSETVGQTADTGQKLDGISSLPTAMLQRIAGAVTAEAQQMRTEANLRSHQIDNAHFLTTAKASEGAVRLLNIQLHPADLGLITVKMRLSGDSLEMQIQVSNEETAQLLRNDAEKLSGLLKGAGYQPDVITIQNGPTASFQTDGSQSQRQQSTSQARQEAFERGAQQQGGESQHREQHYQDERKGGRHDASGESSPNNRSAGGVYL